LKTVQTVADLGSTLDKVRNKGESIALVPTMGALHQGHLELVKLAQKHSDYVVVSIFVNPKQFNSAEDLVNYPRTDAADERLLNAVGADLLFRPGVDDIYPSQGAEVPEVLAGAAGAQLEGASRPGHFDGVLTVVSRLFDLVRPNLAVFGEKDAQQLFLVTQMTATQNREDLRGYPIRIMSAPTVREDSGLAMSSRNMRLSEVDRQLAAQIYSVLSQVAEALQGGYSSTSALREAKEKFPSPIKLDYIELVSTSNFEPVPPEYCGDAILVFAGELSGVRLIDNVRVVLPESSG
jgi:pantoate--beta-alanine ligase